MPLSSLLGALLICAEPTVGSLPQSNDSAADALRRTPISVRQEQERLLADLKVQAALREARKQLAEHRFEAAMATLEPWLRHADGCDKFLTTLETAYRAQIGVLVREHKTDAARLLLDRLQSLSPSADGKLEAYRPIEQPAAKTPTSAQTPSTVELAAASVPTPKKNPPNLLAQLIPFAKSTPKKTADPKIVARAKLDDRDEPELVAAAGTVSTTATQAKPGRRNPIRLTRRNATDKWSAAAKASRLLPATRRARFGRPATVATTACPHHLREHGPLTNSPKRPPTRSGAWERTSNRAAGSLIFPTTQIRRRAPLLQSGGAPGGDRPAAAMPTVTRPPPRSSDRGRRSPRRRRFPTCRARWASWSAWTANFRIMHRDARWRRKSAKSPASKGDAHQLWFADEPLEDWKPVDLLYPTAQEFASTTKQMPQSPAFARIDNAAADCQPQHRACAEMNKYEVSAARDRHAVMAPLWRYSLCGAMREWRSSPSHTTSRTSIWPICLNPASKAKDSPAAKSWACASTRRKCASSTPTASAFAGYWSIAAAIANWWPSFAARSTPTTTSTRYSSITGSGPSPS